MFPRYLLMFQLCKCTWSGVSPSHSSLRKKVYDLHFCRVGKYVVLLHNYCMVTETQCSCVVSYIMPVLCTLLLPTYSQQAETNMINTTPYRIDKKFNYTSKSKINNLTHRCIYVIERFLSSMGPCKMAHQNRYYSISCPGTGWTTLKHNSGLACFGACQG